MGDDWVTVGAFPTLVEAELARNRLAEEGIAAHLSDGEAITMMPFYSGALGGVKLLVSEEQAGRAEAILLRIKRGHHHSRRDDYGLEESITDVPDKVSVPLDEDRPAAEEEEEEEEIKESPRDVIARRAWRAAVFGLFCPGFMHVFSVFFLLEIPETQGELTSAGRSCILGALVIDALVFIFIVAFVISAYVR